MTNLQPIHANKEKALLAALLIGCLITLLVNALMHFSSSLAACFCSFIAGFITFCVSYLIFAARYRFLIACPDIKLPSSLFNSRNFGNPRNVNYIGCKPRDWRWQDRDFLS